MVTKGLFIYTETSLHAGVGSTVSSIDLPIQRERTTQFPIVQGSGIKGALRSQVKDGTDTETLFGAKNDTKKKDGAENDAKKKDDLFAGAVAVGDARIVLFPVRSLMGVFAYVTCPQVLARLQRGLSEASITDMPVMPTTVLPEQALVCHINDVSADNRVVLEEFSFAAAPHQEVTNIADWLGKNALPKSDEYAYWRNKITQSLVILSDDNFRDFVVNSTEVDTHVRLDSATKVVIDGALWTQESLPADALLLSTIVLRTSRNQGEKATQQQKDAKEKQIGDWLTAAIPPRIQIGGDETTGQGFVALNIYPKEEAQS